MTPADLAILQSESSTAHAGARTSPPIDLRTTQILERRRASRVVRDRGWLIRRALVGADIGGLVFAFVVTGLVVSQGAGLRFLSFQEELVLFLATVPGWVVLFKLYRLYDRDEGSAYHSTIDDLGRVFHALLIGSWLYALARYAFGLGSPHFIDTTVFWLTAVGATSVARASARAWARTRIEFLQNTVIVGAGEVGQLVARKFLQHPEYGVNLVGFVDADPKRRRDDLDHLVLLGSPEELPELIRLLDVERVVLAFSNENDADVLDLVRSLNTLQVQVDVVPRLFDIIGPGVHVHTVEGLPLIGLPPLDLTRSSRFLKRALDLLVALPALVLVSPILAAVAIAVRLDSRGPVLFRQTRAGQGGRPFGVLKFRTMIADAEERKVELAHLNRHLRAGGDTRMFKIENDPRVTRVGRLLRRYFLDELPQLLNVVRGEMSLIGPRPLILDEARHVDDWGRRRLDLKPGMTGVWQVLGRSQIAFEEMVKLDYLYVTTWSLGNDLRLLLETVPLVLRGEAPV